jgi:Rrf2 family protein
VKLSLRGEYTLRALLALGKSHGQTVQRIHAISHEQNIPKRFLEQILNDLKSAGFVESKRGVAGGYRLAKPADQILLSEVIRHVEGALAPVSCVSERFYQKCSCPDEQKCAIRSVMKEVREAIVNILANTTVADLSRRAQQLQGDPAQSWDYSI